MPENTSRRQVLALFGVGAAAAFLKACGPLLRGPEGTTNVSYEMERRTDPELYVSGRHAGDQTTLQVYEDMEARSDVVKGSQPTDRVGLKPLTEKYRPQLEGLYKQIEGKIEHVRKTEGDSETAAKKEGELRALAADVQAELARVYPASVDAKSTLHTTDGSLKVSASGRQSFRDPTNEVFRVLVSRKDADANAIGKWASDRYFNPQLKKFAERYETLTKEKWSFTELK